MKMRDKAAKNLQFAARNALGATEITALPLHLWSRYRKGSPNESTALCLEGFSRSANSFLYNAVRLWNPELPIAHHLHLAAPVKRAVRNKVPTILLVRDPVDAVTSNIVADTNLLPAVALEAWILFYSQVLPVARHCVVADFETALKATPVIERANRRLGCRLKFEPLTPQVQNALKARLEEHNRRADQPALLVAVPSAEKDAVKKEIRPQVARLARLPKAYQLYREMMVHASWCRHAAAIA